MYPSVALSLLGCIRRSGNRAEKAPWATTYSSLGLRGFSWPSSEEEKEETCLRCCQAEKGRERGRGSRDRRAQSHRESPDWNILLNYIALLKGLCVKSYQFPREDLHVEYYCQRGHGRHLRGRRHRPPDDEAGVGLGGVGLGLPL